MCRRAAWLPKSPPGKFAEKCAEKRAEEFAGTPKFVSPVGQRPFVASCSIFRPVCFLVNKRLLFIPPPCQLIVTLANGHACPRVMNYDILSSRKTNLAPCQLTVCRWVDSWVAISKFRDYWQQNSCSKKVPSSKDDLLCSAGSLRLLSRLVLGQRKKKNATTASGCEFGIKILRFFPKKGGLWNKRGSLVPALKGFCVPPFAQPGVPV